MLFSFHRPRNPCCDPQTAQESQNAETDCADHSNKNVFTRKFPHLRHREIRNFWHFTEVVELIDLNKQEETEIVKRNELAVQLSTLSGIHIVMEFDFRCVCAREQRETTSS